MAKKNSLHSTAFRARVETPPRYLVAQALSPPFPSMSSPTPPCTPPSRKLAARRSPSSDFASPPPIVRTFSLCDYQVAGLMQTVGHKVPGATAKFYHEDVCINKHEQDNSPHTPPPSWLYNSDRQLNFDNTTESDNEECRTTSRYVLPDRVCIFRPRSLSPQPRREGP
jgi:hypothetical protein